MAIYNVSNGTQLSAALAHATGGDVVRLASGNYGAVSIANFNPTGLVTIVSASSSAQAHFDSLNIYGAQNLAFRGLDIGRALATGEGEYTKMVDIRDSGKVSFSNVAFHGTSDGNADNDGWGLFASNVTGLVVSNSKFNDLTRAFVVQQIQDLRVDHNEFRDLRSDGIDVSASRNVLLDGNLFQGFHPADGDHPDAIQFFNIGQPHGSSDITIVNNILLPGGEGPQGIFLADGGPEGYSNVTIQNNLLWSNWLYNGILVSEGNGIKILDNTVISPTGDASSFWIRLGNSNNVVLSGNVTDSVVLDAGVTGLQNIGNLVFSDTPSARSLIGNLNAPTSPSDLIVPGKGFHLVAESSPSSVGMAVGSGIGDLISKATVASTPVGHVSDLSGAKPLAADADAGVASSSALAVASPVIESLATADHFHTPHAMVSSRGWMFEHYIALP